MRDFGLPSADHVSIHWAAIYQHLTFDGLEQARD
jgi:hypothetical protein